METLNKKALAEKISDTVEITKKDATLIVETIFDSIVEAVKNGDKVDIAGFGKFEITERSARTGINPATKEKIQIPATKAPKFKAAKAFKEAVK